MSVTELSQISEVVYCLAVVRELWVGFLVC